MALGSVVSGLHYHHRLEFLYFDETLQKCLSSWKHNFIFQGYLPLFWGYENRGIGFP